MVTVWGRVCWGIGLAGTLAIGGGCGPSARLLAQTVPDTTLGAESSTVVPGGVIRGVLSDRIDGGALRGINLFHSFLQFNVNENQGVYFSNPNGVENILARVTGGNPSAILGRLGVLGSANLYLLNPNGILFGPNASLDVQGSFVASTASAIRLGNNGEFSATQPETSTLLAVQPEALFLNGLASITNQGNLTAGQGLRLEGSSISSTGQLSAPAISVRAAVGNAVVQSVTAQTADLTANANLQVGNVNAQTATLATNSNLVVQNITAATATLSAAQVLTVGAMTAQTATLAAGSTLVVQTANVAGVADFSAGTDLLASDVTAQTATLAAGNDLRVQTVTGTTATLSAGHNLTARNVNAQTATLTAQNDVLLTGSQFNVAGILTLTAQNQVVLRDTAGSPFLAQVGGNLLIQGDRGIDIQLNNSGSRIQVGGSLRLASSNGSVIAKAPFSVGGSFAIDTIGDIALGDYTGAGLDFTAGGSITLGNVNTSSTTGNGGPVSLISSSGNITLGSVDTSSTIGSGGFVTLKTLGSGDISVQSIRSFSAAPTGGNGGAVTLTSTGGNLTAGAIDAAAIAGYGGSVVLQAPTANLSVRSINTSSVQGNGGLVSLSPSGGLNPGDINASSTTGNGGSIGLLSTSGAINTTAGRLDSSSSMGNGGRISLTANGDITTGAATAASGGANGGAISLRSNNGAIDTNAGPLNSASAAAGRGGEVSLVARNDIATATIDTSSTNGSGGNISLTSSNGAIDTSAGNLLAPVTTEQGGSGGQVSLQAATGIRVASIRTDGADQGAGGNIWINSDRGGITTVANQEINSSTFGVGVAGDIVVTGESVSLEGVSVDASTSGRGNGGSVLVTAKNNGLVTIANTQINTTVKKSDATGVGGNIAIAGGTVRLSGSKLDASTNGPQSGGSVAIAAGNGTLTLDNSGISSDTTAAGQGGNLNLTAPTISLENDSRISARTLGSGQGGSVFVNAADGTVTLAGSSRISTAVDLTATGNGGGIDILAQSVSLTGGGRLEALTRGPGDAGNIQITASNLVNVSGANPYGLYSGLLTSSETSNSGRGGNITINSSTHPQGTLRVADGAFLSARTLSRSPGGNIEVNVDRLELLSGGQLIASAFNTGAAGNITVNATQGITIAGGNPNFSNSPTGTAPNPNGSGSIVATEPNNSIGQAQVLTSSAFSLSPNPEIEFATTLPHVTVTASGNESFDYYAFKIETPDSRGIFDIDTGASALDTQLFLFDATGKLLDSNDDAPIAAGAGGSTDSFNSYLNYGFVAPGTYVIGVGLYPSNGNQGGPTPISGTPLATGNTYQLQVSIETNRNFNPNESAASGLFAQSRGAGPAGTLNITTPQLVLRDGAQATVSNTGSGTAGNLNLAARSVLLSNGSKLAAETSAGSGGDIQLRHLETLQLDNSQISASTVDGQGGTLSVSAARSIDLNNGSGLFARASGEGTAGNLMLSTQQLSIQNRSEISTSTAGRGSAGQIDAQADSLLLTNGSKITSRSTGTGNAGSITLDLSDRLRSSAGEISASSEQGGGGNITLTARDILLRNSSLISTRVSSGSGGGGNITITAKDIFIALEDSDILANADDGIGGRIDIKAPVFIADIFANVGQNPGKDFSRFRGNGRVDISASSRFGISGIVSIPDFSFLQNSLDRLSENFVTPEQIVAGSCLAQRNVEQGSFIAVGTGGLPAAPYGVMRSRYSLVGVRSLGGQQAGSSGTGSLLSKIHNLQTKIPSATWKPGDPIQEAQGFMPTIDGRVVLGTDAQLAEIAKAQELICGEVSPTGTGNHL